MTLVPRIGIGYDAHQLVNGRALILGGVEIPHETGLLGHSDADVLTHVIMDALLGALSLGSIGHHFPDTDAAYKDCRSVELLKRVMALVREKGYRIGNVDSVIVAQQPTLNPYLDAMKTCLAEAMGVSADVIGIKATTTERLGFEGEEKGMSAQAVVMLVPL